MAVATVKYIFDSLMVWVTVKRAEVLEDTEEQWAAEH